MRYCAKCGREMAENAAFCVSCGAPVVQETLPVVGNEMDREEREFLENTHQLLRWEMKAWSIASKVFLISGIAFAGLFLLIALVATRDSGWVSAYFFVCAILYGGMFIGFGVVSQKACEKLPLYINTVYADFSLAYNRCGNIGMLVFTALFGVVSPVFFIINFVRMKANRAVIESIMSKQRMGG